MLLLDLELAVEPLIELRDQLRELDAQLLGTAPLVLGLDVQRFLVLVELFTLRRKRRALRPVVVLDALRLLVLSSCEVAAPGADPRRKIVLGAAYASEKLVSRGGFGV